MEFSDKYKITKEKYNIKTLTNSSKSAKNINDSFKINRKYILKINEYKKSETNNIYKCFSKYTYLNYRNDQKYMKSNYDSQSSNNIDLRKKNIIKINLNYKVNMKRKNNSKDKNLSKNIKSNNDSLLLSERLKNKTLDLLSGCNSNYKNKDKNVYFNDNENFILGKNKFFKKNNGLNTKSPKTTRRNTNNLDLEKNFEYFKQLESKIKEIKNRIKNTKNSLNEYDIKFNLNNINSNIINHNNNLNYNNISNYNNINNKKNHNNISNNNISNNNINNISKHSSNKNIGKKSIPKIEDLILSNKSNNTSNINSIKNESTKNSLMYNLNNENIKNKNEFKKQNNNNSLYTISNYYSKNKSNINDDEKKIPKKKTSYLPVFLSSYKKNKYILSDKKLNLPIKTKKKKLKSQNKSKNNYDISQNSSTKKNKYFPKNNIYSNYMTMTPDDGSEIIKKTSNNFKTPNIKTTKNKVVNKNKFHKPLSNSSLNLYNLSSSKILEKRNNKKIKCLRNKKLSKSSNISHDSNKDNEITNKIIIKNASICRIGKNRENETDKINQDTLFKIKYEDLNLSFYGVCDGHGPYGHLVSNFIKTNLPIILYQHLCLNIQSNAKDINYNNQLIKSLKDAFYETNYKLSYNSNINIDLSGTTCISILFNNKQVIMANIGDSRAIKGQYISQNKKWIFQILNKEHKPEKKEEYIRITKCKGVIHPYLNEDNEYVGPQRVWIKGKNIPGLAMSRSLGDKMFESVGVISTPDILCFKHKIIDKFIVIASDGLWMYVSNQEVVDILGKYYEKVNCDEAIEELYFLAKSRFEENDDFIDDITIIILFLE